MDCNIDLEKIASATVMKDGPHAAAAIGSAVLECAETAAHLFKGSLGLDITAFVIAKVEEAAKDVGKSEIDIIRKKGAVVAGVAPKRRGRPQKKEAKEG